MKIARIHIYRFSIRMEPFAIATGVMRYAQNTLISVETDEGLSGSGECSAFPMIVGETQETCIALAKDFARIWKGKDPLALEDRLTELDNYVAGNTTIKSAFDMALYDLAAKAANLPLYKFLGGERKSLETDITVGLGDAREMAEKARRFSEQGAKTLKVKLGSTPGDDIERIRQIRLAVGDQLIIRIDANQGWTFDEAKIALKELSAFNIQFCEQPMRRFNDYRLNELRKLTTVPIMADESCYDHHDASRLIRDRSCDSINIKLSKSGGIREAIRIHDVASAAGIPCMIGGMLESRLALTAKAHFASAFPNIVYHDLDTCMLGHLEDPVDDGVEFKGFTLNLPNAPGIGAKANPTFLKKCERWSV